MLSYFFKRFSAREIRAQHFDIKNRSTAAIRKAPVLFSQVYITRKHALATAAIAAAPQPPALAPVPPTFAPLPSLPGGMGLTALQYDCLQLLPHLDHDDDYFML